jgi:hypothetical protein
MWKISRIRPCEYNKSCSIVNNESNKIGLAFFRNFYDFLRILQIPAKRVYYWRCIFATRPLERFRTVQLGPSTHGTADSPEIRRFWRRSRPGNSSGSIASSPRVGWRSWFGRRSRRRGGSAAAVAARGSGEEKRTDDNMRLWEVLRVLGREWDGRPAAGATGAANSSMAAAMEGGGSVGAQRVEWRRLNRGLAGRGCRRRESRP